MVKTFDDNPSHPLRALQIWQILIGAAHNRQILTYKILSEMLKFRGAGTMADPLRHIMYFCQQNNLPPLTILIVNKETGLPGDGLINVRLNEDRESVYGYNWYSIVPPTPEELKEAFQRGNE